jgi:putative transposase
MSGISKEILRNYIKEQNFTSPNQVLDAMKDMFKDVLQETLEAEMDTQLGYDKYDVSEKQTSNSRNGYSKKIIKSELGPKELTDSNIDLLLFLNL